MQDKLGIGLNVKATESGKFVVLEYDCNVNLGKDVAVINTLTDKQIDEMDFTVFDNKEDADKHLLTLCKKYLSAGFMVTFPLQLTTKQNETNKE